MDKSAITVELPESLRKSIEALAAKEGYSVSQFLASAAGDKVGVVLTMDYLRREANAGRREDLEKYLTAVPDVAPPENDRLGARTPHAEPCQSAIETVAPARLIMTLTAEVFQKWQCWMKEVKEDVQHSLVYPRQVFRHFRDVVKANAQHVEHHDGFVFVNFVQRAYVAQIVMGIRRHVKKSDKKSISLMLLLDQIHRCASQFTCDFFLRQFPIDNPNYDRPTYRELEANTFRCFSGEGTTVSAAIVQEDMDQLQNLGARIEDLADRTIAHLDKRGCNESVTHGELDNCIDAFDRLVCKYLMLFTGAGMATLEPSILYNWEKIFTVPLDVRGRG